jgi:hypothetical protein
VTAFAGVFADDASRRAAEAALAAATAEQPRAVELLGRGNRKQTALVRFDDRGPVVLQLCDEQTWLRTESVLLTRLRRETEVPVSPVLAAGTSDEVAFIWQRTCRARTSTDGSAGCPGATATFLAGP